MRLLSWNVCDTNPDVIRIRDFLMKIQPDVAVFQEVLPQQVEVLKDHYSHVAVARDSIYGDIKSYLVIASNHVLSNVKITTHYADMKKKPSILAKFTKLDQFLDTLTANIVDDAGKNISIINMHTSAYASPTVRREEIELCLRQVPRTGASIIAGDFNSYAHPMISWLMALPLGFGLTDLTCRESFALKARFAEFGFTPSVCGVTYPKFGFELDQVFTRAISTKSAAICDNLWGSDHYPILIELA